MTKILQKTELHFLLFLQFQSKDDLLSCCL